MSDDEQQRRQGVTFGSLADDLESASYPLAEETVLDRYGDRDLAFADGETTVWEVLEPLGVSRFDTPGGLERAIVSMIEGDAVGREGYTDRGSGTAGEATDESLSTGLPAAGGAAPRSRREPRLRPARPWRHAPAPGRPSGFP